MLNESETRRLIINIVSVTANQNVFIIHLVLDSLFYVKKTAHAFRATAKTIDLLANNAGMRDDAELSADGFEHVFATNLLGHFLITFHLLLERQY